MDSLPGILEMEVDSSDEYSEEEGEILSPKASIAGLTAQAEEHRTFSSWLTVMKSGNLQLKENQVSPIPILQPKKNTNVMNIDVLQIMMDDIQDEVYHWNSSIICSVLGGNPPLSAIEGFFRRIWKILGIILIRLRLLNMEFSL